VSRAGAPARAPMATATPRGDDWRPAAGLEVLRQRATLLARIRAFFAERGVLEVETPLLGSAPSPEPHLASVVARLAAGTERYLQTSPEFAMKRLLAAGAGPIYQITRAFRDGEAGRLHNPEFTILEWYRPGYDHHRLMDELEALLAAVLGRPLAVRRIAYRDAFRERLGVDPLTAPLAELRARCLAHGLHGAERLGRGECCDFLLARRVQPGLGAGAVFLFDFPPGQASLARVRRSGPAVAERFELFLDGLEVANGYREELDPAEQRRRFERDRAARAARGLAPVPLDERLLAALAAGLPDCAGVAVGIDRLVMHALGCQRIAEVLAFPFERA